MYCQASGLTRSRTCWWRHAQRQPAAVLVATATDGPTIQSGCARATSESRLTISGSTHSPNSMPWPVTASISGVRPSGHRPSSTYQSPRPAWSSRRPRNQPSSRTKRSTPSSGGRFGEFDQGLEVVVEVDGLPGVEHHRAGLARSRGADVVRPGPEPGVEGLADAVQAAAGVGGEQRRASGSCRRGAGSPRPGRAARRRRSWSGRPRRLSANCSWLPLQPRCVAQTLPVAVAEAGGPGGAAAARSRGRSGRAGRCGPRCPAGRRGAAGGVPGTSGRSGRGVRGVAAPPGSTVASSSSWYGDGAVVGRAVCAQLQQAAVVQGELGA